MTHILMALLLSTTLTASPLIRALEQVESGGDASARSPDGRAIGCLQITAAVVEDVNRHRHLKWPHSAALDPTHARIICRRYLAIYATEQRLGRPPTDRDRALIWRMGPNGWRHPERAADYWQRVEALIAAQD